MCVMACAGDHKMLGGIAVQAALGRCKMRGLGRRKGSDQEVLCRKDQRAGTLPWRS